MRLNSLWQPVACNSSSLSPTEQRYAQTGKETLAIVHAFHMFDQLLFGKADVVVPPPSPLPSPHTMGFTLIGALKSWVTDPYMKLEPLVRVNFISIFRTTAIQTNNSNLVEFLMLTSLWQIPQQMLPRTSTPRK